MQKFIYILECHKYSSCSDNDYDHGYDEGVLTYSNQKEAEKSRARYNRLGYTTYLHRKPVYSF